MRQGSRNDGTGLLIILGIAAFIFLLYYFSFNVFANEREDCILDKMPGVQNDAAALAIYHNCKERHPRPAGYSPEKRTGWLEYKSGAECTAKKAKNTPSIYGGRAIYFACKALYEPGAVDSLQLKPFTGRLDSEK